VARDGQVGWLGEALAAPRFHLLLWCRSTDALDTSQLAALHYRLPDMLAMHYLTQDAAPGALHDGDGQALARLGVNDTAHYLIRPDGHIGYRAAGTDLTGLQHYLARWFPPTTPAR
jgi:hypothetical protein